MGYLVSRPLHYFLNPGLVTCYVNVTGRVFSKGNQYAVGRQMTIERLDYFSQVVGFHAEGMMYSLSREHFMNGHRNSLLIWSIALMRHRLPLRDNFNKQIAIRN